MAHQYAPLIIDDVPVPSSNDKHRRFRLFNYSNSAIKLSGFSLENQDGQSFELSEVDIRPNGHIVIALKAAKKESDIVVPVGFKFDFAENEKLFLCDSNNQKQQIFPAADDIYASLDKWNECPLKAMPFGSSKDGIQGFILQNVTGKDICLVNHYITNRRGTFRVKVPENKMRASDFFRLITVCNDESNVVLQANDILVQNDEFVCVSDDALLLRDAYGTEHELYALDESHNIKSKCFVM